MCGARPLLMTHRAFGPGSTFGHRGHTSGIPRCVLTEVHRDLRRNSVGNNRSALDTANVLRDVHMSTVVHISRIAHSGAVSRVSSVKTTDLPIPGASSK